MHRDRCEHEFCFAFVSTHTNKHGHDCAKRVYAYVWTWLCMVCVNIARYAISCRTYTMWCVVEHLHVSNEWPRISHRAYKRHDTPTARKRQNDGRGGHLNCNRLYIYNHLVPWMKRTKKIHRKKKNYNTNGECVMCAHQKHADVKFRNKKNIYHICVEHLMWCGCKKNSGVLGAV